MAIQRKTAGKPATAKPVASAKKKTAKKPTAKTAKPTAAKTAKAKKPAAKKNKSTAGVNDNRTRATVAVGDVNYGKAAYIVHLLKVNNKAKKAARRTDEDIAKEVSSVWDVDASAIQSMRAVWNREGDTWTKTVEKVGGWFESAAYDADGNAIA